MKPTFLNLKGAVDLIGDIRPQHLPPALAFLRLHFPDTAVGWEGP